MRAVNRCRGFQHLSQLCRQSRVTESPIPSREFIAIFEIAELIFQLNEFGGKEQVLGGVVRYIVGDRIVPDMFFGWRQRRSRFRRSV